MSRDLVDGDPYPAECSIDQYLLWRPLRGVKDHATPVRNLDQIGASTHPGPGLSGTAGDPVANALSRRSTLSRMASPRRGPLHVGGASACLRVHSGCTGRPKPESHHALRSPAVDGSGGCKPENEARSSRLRPGASTARGQARQSSLPPFARGPVAGPTLLGGPLSSRRCR